MVAIDDGRNCGYASGGRGGFPVFQAAALESRGSEKGGPYALGDENGQPGSGIAGRRQFGVFDIEYADPARPKAIWTAFRAERNTGTVTQLLKHEFPRRQTFDRF